MRSSWAPHDSRAGPHTTWAAVLGTRISTGPGRATVQYKGASPQFPESTHYRQIRGRRKYPRVLCSPGPKQPRGPLSALPTCPGESCAERTEETVDALRVGMGCPGRLQRQWVQKCPGSVLCPLPSQRSRGERPKMEGPPRGRMFPLKSGLSLAQLPSRGEEPAALLAGPREGPERSSS